MASSSTRAFAGYRVGEISEALVTKGTTAKLTSSGNGKLNALFNSAKLFSTEFVPVIAKVRGHISLQSPHGH